METGTERVSPEAFAGADAPRPLAQQVADADARREERAGRRRPAPADQPRIGGAALPQSLGAEANAQVVSQLVTVTPGAPVLAADPGDPISDPVLLDERVGDINGRPIFAREFLEPLSGRLLAEAERMPLEQWQRFAAEQIKRELDSLVVDELLRAEAIDKLDENQRQGLRAFIERVRGNLQSQNLGSRQLAAQRLAETEGVTEEQFLRRRQEEALIRLALDEQIERRVTVSWRDIVRRYNQQQDRWNPDPSAVLRIARVRTSDDSAVQSMADASSSLETFVEFAASEQNRFTANEAGRLEVPLESSFADTTIFPNEQLDELAHSVDQGEVSGPLELGPFTYRMALEAINVEATPLYEAQLQIEQELKAQLQEQELARYVENLTRRARVQTVAEVGVELLQIAERWYGPSRAINLR
ncbi:MAG: hypothetical protein AAGI17_08040 [Planctomycetota bacterium]